MLLFLWISGSRGMNPKVVRQVNWMNQIQKVRLMAVPRKRDRVIGFVR